MKPEKQGKAESNAKGERLLSCRPHHWRTPRPGDMWLTCDVCGRLLPLHELESWHVRSGVLKAYAKRLGRPAAEEFAKALSETLNAYVEKSTPLELWRK